MLQGVSVVIQNYTMTSLSALMLVYLMLIGTCHVDPVAISHQFEEIRKPNLTIGQDNSDYLSAPLSPVVSPAVLQTIPATIELTRVEPLDDGSSVIESDVFNTMLTVSSVNMEENLGSSSHQHWVSSVSVVPQGMETTFSPYLDFINSDNIIPTSSTKAEGPPFHSEESFHHDLSPSMTVSTHPHSATSTHVVSSYRQKDEFSVTGSPDYLRISPPVATQNPSMGLSGDSYEISNAFHTEGVDGYTWTDTSTAQWETTSTLTVSPSPILTETNVVESPHYQQEHSSRQETATVSSALVDASVTIPLEEEVTSRDVEASTNTTLPLPEKTEEKNSWDSTTTENLAPQGTNTTLPLPEKNEEKNSWDSTTTENLASQGINTTLPLTEKTEEKNSWDSTTTEEYFTSENETNVTPMVPDKVAGDNSTKTGTLYNFTLWTNIQYSNLTTGATIVKVDEPTEKPVKNFTIINLEPIATTTPGKSPPSTTTVGKTKETKNTTLTIPTIAMPTTSTKSYTKPSEPTKYPPKPDNVTPTPKKKQTTERTTSKNDVDNETPWRPPVYISAKLRMTMSELCSQLHDFSTIILGVLETKLGEKAFQYTVVVLEELQCIPDMDFEKFRRDAEITVNFFLVDPRGKYDMEVTEKLAALIAESKVDTAGTVFGGKIVAFKVHGVADKGLAVGKSSSAPTKNKELSGGMIALVVVAAITAIIILTFVIFQLMVCRRRMGMKKMRHVYDGSRPSLECHSIVDSIQLTGVTTFTEQGSKPSFAYYNPALHIGDPNKDFSSNALDAIGIEEMLEEPDAIEDEFLMLPNVMPKLSEVPVGAEDKNRYANVIPFPSTRVPLSKLEGEEHSEYINANFIRGYLGHPHCYIATQAPLEDTRGDFWRMIWEQQSRVVIMLTDLEEQGLSKCAEYWPNTDGADKVRIYGDYEIILQRREVTENWIQSTMILKHLDRNLCREIQHYWLTCWPDHGTPDDPSVLLRFLLHVRPDMDEYRGPTVVHCSPGTGRTGTLLSLDICMRSLDDTETVDVLGTVHMLRQDRAGAVQTQEQYFFIYKAVLQYAVKFCNATRSYKSSIASLELQHR